MVALHLTTQFLDSSRGLLGVSKLSPAEVEARLAALLEQARAAHREIELPAGPFIAALAGSVADGTEIADALDRVHAADLYLATACARGVAGALDRLEALHLTRLPRAIGRVDDSPAFVAEVIDRLRDKLMIGGADRRPRIADYAGRDPLGVWIRAAALRTALNLKASIQPYIEPPEDRPPEALIDGDQELESLRRTRAAVVEAAIAEAFGELDSRERAALRLHFIDGLELDQIGRIYNVYRATVARWISQTRERVRARARLER